MPITSNPDAFYLGEEDFLERFGFEKPMRGGTGMEEGGAGGGKMQESPFSAEMKSREARSGLNAEGVNSMDVNEKAGSAFKGTDHDGGEGEGKGIEEVIFYCKAGVRSRAAARMAREWEGLRVGQYEEGWLGWEGKGGKVER